MKNIILIAFCLVSLVSFCQNLTKEEEADIKKLELMMEPLQVQIKNFNEKIEQSKQRIQIDESYRLEIQARYDEIQSESYRILSQFIKENPDSSLSVALIGEMMSMTSDLDAIETLFNSLSKKNRNSKKGKTLQLKIESEKKTAIGSVAPDFTQMDVNNMPVKLSDFRGKYVLLDFWASWCGPCRKENPHVVKAYEQFKDKNFEILGVSLDNPGQRETWLNAIKRDGLTWPQVSDLNGWQNEVAQQYGIFSIPKNFLLDPEGVIIAKDLRGEELISILSQILN